MSFPGDQCTQNYISASLSTPGGYVLVMPWNGEPREVVKSPSLGAFKTHTDTVL